jgi:soluble lytic murein transglycosylase-like protein
VVDDEVVPEPEPVAEELAAALEAPVPLRFEDSVAKVPEGPYGGLIYEAARRHSINPQVVAALIRAESAGNPRAVSRKGARGLMQLMPATAQRFGTRKESLFDPKANLEAGIRYLSWLVEQFPGDLSKVLAAYNAGENAVLRYGGIPPYRETREYVRRIYSTLGLTVAGL